MDGQLSVAKSSSAKPRSGVLIGSATAADHAAIHHFLMDALPWLSEAEFRASLDDPFYEPNDRIVLRRDSTIVGHALTVHRAITLNGHPIPVGGLAQVALDRELCGRGVGRKLLESAENRLAGQGAVLGLLTAPDASFFRRRGWTVLEHPAASRASARDLLTVVNTRTRRYLQHPLNIRLWRQVEIDALRRVYRNHTASWCGPMFRTEAYWKWLIGRGAHDRIYIALDGPHVLELEESRTRVVGYAVTRGDRILELCTDPAAPRADVQLLARICGDAIELDHHCLTLETPPQDRLHGLFALAAPQCETASTVHRRQVMAKIFDLSALLSALSAEWEHRARQANLKQPIDLGFLVGKQKCRLRIASTGVSVTPHSLGRSYLEMRPERFLDLLLARTDWASLRKDRHTVASTSLAESAAEALFPPLLAWHHLWDGLPARQ